MEGVQDLPTTTTSSSSSSTSITSPSSSLALSMVVDVNDNVKSGINGDSADDSLNDVSLAGEGRSLRKGLPIWNEPVLGTLNDFAKSNSKYPYCIVTLYQIIRDLHIKQEVVDIKIIDGKKWGRQEYFIGCRARSNDVERLLIPFHLDADIDLPWLQMVAAECKAKDKDLYLCIHTSETIIYESVTIDLP